MPTSVASTALVGIDGVPVEVEVDVAPGIPATRIVGLPDTAVGEARERIRSAIRAAGYTWPARRITINLAPADLRKSGGSFDLAIAIGIAAREASRRLVSSRLTAECATFLARCHSPYRSFQLGIVCCYPRAWRRCKGCAAVR
jgi:hypothetical protein